MLCSVLLFAVLVEFQQVKYAVLNIRPGTKSW